MGIASSLFKIFWGNSEDESAIDPNTGLSLLQKRLIVESWRALGTRKQQKKFGVEFFIQLFRIYPAQQGLFPLFKGRRLDDLEISPVMRAHATTVMYSIGSLVENLDDPECLVGLVEKIAKNHVVREVGFKEFEELRLMFGPYLESQLGTEATPEVKGAWDKLLSVMNSIIKTHDEKKTVKSTT